MRSINKKTQCDSSVAIGLTGLVLTRNESEVSRDLATVFEAMRIVDAGNEDLGRPRSNAWNGSKSDNPRISLADSLELLDNDIHMHRESIHLSQFDVKFAFPEFVGFTLGERLTKGVDSFASGVPSFIASIDHDAMIDVPGTNDAFHLVDPTIERLAVLNQRTELTMGLGGHVNRFEFVYGSHSSKFQGVILVGFAFDVGPLPGVFIGRTDECLEAVAYGKIIDPAGRPAGFHDDEVEFVLF